MAEEFHQAGICGETWWGNLGSTRSLFPLMMGSTCSVAANDSGSNNYGTNWQTDFMDLKAATRLSCSDEDTNHNNNSNNFVSNGNIVTSLGFLDDDHNNKACESDAGNGTGSILIDSTMQMMGFGSSNWNHQSLFRCNNGRAENNFNSVLEEETCLDSSCNNNSQIQKPMMEQNQFSGGFPMGSGGSYGYNNTSTNLMQSLYEPQTQNTVLYTNQPMSYNSCSTTTNNTSTQLSSTWSTSVSSLMKPSVPKQQQQQQQQLNGLQFSNNTPFWNASAEALHDMRAAVFSSSSSSSSQQQYQKPAFEDKPNNAPSTLLNKLKREESPDKASSAANKSASEPAFKRPRIETPSPLPTFKVRKEKLGDRITALQQLVSPFGKTDTASVLHEAIDYIKFLHDQVNVLSTPYMKNGAPIPHHQQNGGCDNNAKDSSEGRKQDLRSRGLCLVPISSTFPMASETTADFWTPTFGGTLIGR